jgi:hypothetical protein
MLGLSHVGLPLALSQDTFVARVWAVRRHGAFEAFASLTDGRIAVALIVGLTLQADACGHLAVGPIAIVAIGIFRTCSFTFEVCDAELSGSAICILNAFLTFILDTKGIPTATITMIRALFAPELNGVTDGIVAPTITVVRALDANGQGWVAFLAGLGAIAVVGAGCDALTPRIAYRGGRATIRSRAAFRASAAGGVANRIAASTIRVGTTFPT